MIITSQSDWETYIFQDLHVQTKGKNGGCFCLFCFVFLNPYLLHEGDIYQGEKPATFF